MSGFLERLTPEAIKRLRLCVRGYQIANGFPREFVDSDMGKREIDKMIDVMAPRTAEDMAKRGMDSGLIEKRVSNRG